MKKLSIAILCAAACQAQQPKPASAMRVFTDEGMTQMMTGMASDMQYEAGKVALDAHRYEDAIRRFSEAAASKSEHADGALYWEAYALNRVGQREKALEALLNLRTSHPGSRWLTDAQALEAEIRQSTGTPASPGDDNNEEIKLMAINSLMNAEPERALPLLEGLLKGNSPPRVKDRALFVVTQNRSPRAQQILVDYAKGAGNPDLQLRAIRYVGMSGTPAAQQQLAAIYSASSDTAVKHDVLRALTLAKGRDQIFTIAKNEKDEGLRREAVRQLGVLHANDMLVQFAKDSDSGVKHEIVNSLRSQGDAKAMVEMARKETDPALKRYIVGQLANMRNNKDATDYMMELLK